ncbi:ATP-binding cassette domain-containing protein [Pseudonocardia sp. GCM10023141]|uniref:ATP-binding cassette domain-containing protein n=1 Tax=Pseudonocardia sp. GCM10023141 TaxID=3252653 RepID=UPI00360C7376
MAVARPFRRHAGLPATERARAEIAGAITPVTDGGAVLRLAGVRKAFSGVRALDGVDLTVDAGTVHALIGPNGSGKTTLLNTCSGFLTPDEGIVQFRGQPAAGGVPARARNGLGRTFQTPFVFAEMSLLENVLAALDAHRRYGMAAHALRLPGARREERANVDRATAILTAVGLAGRSAAPAGALPPGERRLLEIARVVALESGAGAHGRTRCRALGPRDRGAGGRGAGAARRGRRRAARRAPRRSRDAPGRHRHGLVSGFGRVPVLHGIDLAVAEGQLLAVIGANGAGKSTLMRTIIGVNPVVGGNIRFAGADLTKAGPAAVGRAGIALVPEGRRLFPMLTVEENLRLGGWTRRRDRHGAAADRERMFDRFTVLGERRSGMAGALSGGQQQMLAIAMALMARPRLLMLDEPSLGLAPLVVRQVFDEVRALRDAGTTVLLSEQFAEEALAIADTAIVLKLGKVVTSGPAADVRDDDAVRAAYLGA